MKGIALWQFLSFCRVQPVEKGRPSVRFLERVRRLVLLDEDRELGQLPPPARGLNAVRLMTIHGSKGLEFEAVHIPGLVVSGLSRNQTPKRCYPPDGLIEGFGGLTGIEVTRAGHEQEDECLFFVGISRARDTLFTYAYSQMANGNKRNQSKFLGPFAA